MESSKINWGALRHQRQCHQSRPMHANDGANHANDGANHANDDANGTNDGANDANDGAADDDDDHLDQDEPGPLRHQRHQSVKAMHANVDL